MKYCSSEVLQYFTTAVLDSRLAQCPWVTRQCSDCAELPPIVRPYSPVSGAHMALPREHWTVTAREHWAVTAREHWLENTASVRDQCSVL